jgi:hypothetical protein
MTPSPRFTCDYQLAGYPFQSKDEKGAIDFDTFAKRFEEFPWGEQMRKRETMADGCSATISVVDHELNQVFWVSVTGSDRRPTFLLGFVYDNPQQTAGRVEESEVTRMNDIYIAPSSRSVLSTFRTFFAGDTGKLMERLGSYRRFEPNEASSHSPEEPNEQPHGHGDHWQALGLEGDALIEYLEQLMKEADGPVFFPAPWAGAEYGKVIQMRAQCGSLCFVVLSGIDEERKILNLLSAFPTLTKTEEWVVDLEEVSASYGHYEGVVCAKAAAGHWLKFFAPFFGIEADHWRKKGLARVALAGLALKLEKFAAEPIKITAGPLVEEAKRELRAEGKIAEADDPDFHVTVEMDRMRTLYSLNHDHHQIIGRVMSATAIKPLPQFQGWRLEIECMPDEAASGCRLQVFVFPPALGSDAPPRKGDLVTGTVWLQGSWITGEPERDMEIWRESGGE